MGSWPVFSSSLAFPLGSIKCFCVGKEITLRTGKFRSQYYLHLNLHFPLVLKILFLMKVLSCSLIMGGSDTVVMSELPME